ncbi:hypothetical protein PABG_11085 [Paracoccidioides brasiliensis Pb03]|nr:hypothetical protein PABG_11085 [Paracoccidioides brasiliensis Pb03]
MDEDRIRFAQGRGKCGAGSASTNQNSSAGLQFVLRSNRFPASTNTLLVGFRFGRQLVIVGLWKGPGYAADKPPRCAFRNPTIFFQATCRFGDGDGYRVEGLDFVQTQLVEPMREKSLQDGRSVSFNTRFTSEGRLRGLTRRAEEQSRHREQIHW